MAIDGTPKTRSRPSGSERGWDEEARAQNVERYARLLACALGMPGSCFMDVIGRWWLSVYLNILLTMLAVTAPNTHQQDRRSL
jgi:hypothetical protein